MNHRNYYSKKKSDRKNKKIGRFLIIILSVFIAFMIAYSVDSFFYRNKIYPNVHLFQYGIGRLNEAQALEKIRDISNEILNNSLLVVFEGKEYRIIPSEDLGASLNIEKIFQEGYSVARRGNLWNRISERISLFSKPLQISESIRYKEESFNLFYGKLQEWVERPTRDAQLVSSKVISSEVGVEINRIELLKELTNTIINQPESSDIVNKIIIPVNLQKPLISTNEILNQMETNQLLSTYETSLAGKEENTLFNIKKAAADANGIILKPGETFFFNQLIGPAEKEDGYKESIIISNGQFTSGYGGGVCQVSTTIYNAALLANLQIIERYNHSIYGDATSYVPLGQDSAVFYGYKDLKFKNNLEQQIVIFSEVEKDKLIVRILGEQSLDVNIKIITEDKQIIDYDIIELKRKNGNYIENRILQEGIPGYQITTYRLITGSQGERREFISRDQYISVPQKIIVD